MGISMDYFKQTENAASFEIIFQKLTSTEGSTNCTYVFFYTLSILLLLYTNYLFFQNLLYGRKENLCIILLLLGSLETDDH